MFRLCTSWVVLLLCAVVDLPTTSGVAAGFLAAETATASAAVAEKRRARVHRKHRRVRRTRAQRRHRASLERSAAGTTISTGINAALDKLPVRMAELYEEAHAGGATTAFIEALNTMYEGAQKMTDTLTFRCADVEAKTKWRLDRAKDEMQQAEKAHTLLQERMRGLQRGSESALAELQSLRDQFEAHRSKCAANREREIEALKLLGQDEPITTTLIENAEAACSGDAAAGLIECSLPDGSFVVTFQEPTLRQQVAKLSGLSERLLASRLDEAVRGAEALAAPAPDAEGTQLLQKARHRRHHRRHHKVRGGGADVEENSTVVESALSFLEAKQQHRMMRAHAIPDNFCSVAKAPTCDSFKDVLASFKGGVRDLADELEARSSSEAEQCRSSLEAYSTRIDDLKRQNEDAAVALTNVVTQESDVVAWLKERRLKYKEVEEDVTSTREECTGQLKYQEGLMCGAKEVFRSMAKTKGGAEAVGSFRGHCTVSEWMPEENCTASCGKEGTQKMGRKILEAPASDPLCPALTMVHPCNREPCPIDAQMSEWQEWSECSRACNGGTKTRFRRQISRAQHGGVTVGETVQEQVCNSFRCDQDCVLTEWTPWSNCSKVCDGGHRTRVRHVLREALGSGSCPAEDHPSRREAASCNRQTCEGAPRCASMLDLVMLIDSSGSTGATGFDAMKSFLQAVAERIDFDQATSPPGLARVGAVAFADRAATAQALTPDASILASGFTSLVWQKGSTNTAAGLSLAGELLDRYGRNEAPQVILIVTDGMPTSSYVMSTEASRLRDKGVRLAFVVVEGGLTIAPFRRWASWPSTENLMVVQNFHELRKEEFATSVLANLCPVFAATANATAEAAQPAVAAQPAAAAR